MQSVAEDIKDILEAESLSLTYATNLFIGKEPTTPSNCTTIYDTSGYPPQLTIAGQGEDYFYDTMMIIVRNTDYLTGWELAKSIRDALHGRNHETWNSTSYNLIRAINGPNFLDFDEKNRCHFSLNFEVQRA